MRPITGGLICAALMATTSAGAAEFTAPAGQLGAGLGNDPETKARAYVDGTAYYRAGQREFFGSEWKQRQWALPLLLGGGYRIMPELELEGRLAFAAARVKVEVTNCLAGEDCDEATGAFTPANLYVGVNYLIEKNEWLIKVGGALAYGPWTQDPNNDRTLAYIYSAVTRLEDFYMFIPETFSIVAPARVEYRFLPELAFTGDASLVTYIPTGGGDVELSTVLAPGVSYLTGDLVLGGRLPLFWLLTEDEAQFALEPFARYDFNQFFLTGRFTLNLDNPYGFSFDEGNIWGLHVGFGGTF